MINVFILPLLLLFSNQQAFGDDIPFFSFASYLKPAAPASGEVVDCHQGMPKFNNNFTLLTNDLSRINSANACQQLSKDPNARFSENNCQLLQVCRLSKPKLSKAKDHTALTIPKAIAGDYVQFTLDSRIVAMEKLEALRKFAEKKYGKNFDTFCSSPLDYVPTENLAKAKCKIGLIDEGFNKMLSECGSTKENCVYKSDYTSFLKTPKNTQTDQSSMQTFLNVRTDVQVNDSLGNDNEMLETLAGIIQGSRNKKSALKTIIAKLEEYQLQNKLDPAFAIGLRENNLKFFSTLLEKPADIGSIKASIESYRKELTKKELAVACSRTPSVVSICGAATQISRNRRVTLIAREEIANKINDANDDARYAKIAANYQNTTMSLPDFKIVMDATRCQVFNFLPQNGSERESVGFAAGASEIPEDKSVYGSLYSSTWDSNPNSINSSVDMKSVGTSKLSVSTDSAINPSVSNATTSNAFAKSDEVIGHNEPPKVAQVSSTLQVAPVNAIAQNFEVNTEKNKAIAAASSSSSSSSSNPSVNASALSEKINELSKKLTTAEDNIEKAKTEKGNDEKFAAENKSLADLKTQLSDLQKQKSDALTTSQNPTALPIQQPIQQPSRINSAQTSVSTLSPNDFSVHGSEQINRDHEIHSAVSATSSTEHSESISPNTKSSLSNSASKSSSLTLTKMDGLTAEAATLTITEKINEMGGEPFEIEEGGMVKQIVPLTKDGKFLLDEKGMPRFEKIVKRKIKAERKLATNIKDSPDLKRVDEETMKKERVEYLKLKQLTNEALNKK